MNPWYFRRRVIKRLRKWIKICLSAVSSDSDDKIKSLVGATSGNRTSVPLMSVSAGASIQLFSAVVKINSKDI